MYCKKCGLEIQGGTETVCPLCNTALEESPSPEQGAAPDESFEDQKLNELISDIERTITTSLGGEERDAAPKQEALPFDLEGALAGELPAKTGSAASSSPAETAAGDYEKTRAIMEQRLAEIEETPLPIAEPPRRSAMKNSAAVLLILGVIAAGVAAGYLFSPKKPPAIRTAAPVRRTALPDAPKAADVPQPPKQELTVGAAESKPLAPPVLPAAGPVKEPATAETEQPVKQERAPSAAGPVKTAAVQVLQTAPPSVQPSAAERIAPEPPQKPAEQLKMPKTAVAVFYCVNVGSFKLKDSSDRVCRDLKKNGYAPDVEIVTLSNGSTWYRVSVGRFAARDEAAQFGRELEKKTNIKPVVAKKR